MLAAWMLLGTWRAEAQSWGSGNHLLEWALTKLDATPQGASFTNPPPTYLSPSVTGGVFQISGNGGGSPDPQISDDPQHYNGPTFGANPDNTNLSTLRCMHGFDAGTAPAKLTTLQATRTSLTGVVSKTWCNFTFGTVGYGSITGMTLDFARRASTSPDRIQAYLTWFNGSTYSTAWTNLTTVTTSGYTAGPPPVIAWNQLSLGAFSNGAALPTGAALSSKQFLLEFYIYNDASAGASYVEIDNIALLGSAGTCPTITPTLAGTSATVGTAFSQALSSSGGTAPFTYTLASGTLPAGLSISGATITGTPTSTTGGTFTIRSTDANGCTGTSVSYTITPVCPTITVTPGSLLRSTTGTAYTQTTAPGASGISGSFTWTLGGTPPTGMTINASTGALSTTTASPVGLYAITVTATSVIYPSCSGTWSGSFRVCPVITLSPTTLANAVLALNYNTASPSVVSASGGTAAYSYTLSGAPAWMTINASTGQLAGVPTATGSVSFTVNAADANGCPGSRSYTINVLGNLSIGNQVFLDTNGNGIKNAGEFGIANSTLQLWTAGVNSTEENGGGDDVQVGSNVTTDVNGNYKFSNLSPGTYYVRMPTPPIGFPTATTVVNADNGVDNDSNGRQTTSGAAVRSPLIALAAGAEPALAVDGDDTNGDLTVDFGFLNPDACYANNLFDNYGFENTGLANTNGNPIAVLGYNGTSTTFGSSVNSLQWVGGTNGISPFNTPIANMQVLATVTGSKVSWVESSKAHSGKRYMLFQGTNSCLDLRALGGGAWSSVLKPGRTYEIGLYADTASTTDASFNLNLQAGANIFTVAGTSYQYFVATQAKWTGTPATKFAAADYNGWTEATANSTRPNWRKFTFRFSIPVPATTAQIDQASLILAGGTSSGPIVVDDLYLCEGGLSIGNCVWNDLNNNGIKDGTELGVGGAAIQLYLTGADGLVNTADDSLVTSTTSALSGAYVFSGLFPGSYYVKLTPPVAYPLTSGTPATTDNNVDNNNDGSQPGGPTTAVFSPSINLAVGTESITDGDTDPNTNYTVDFGLFSGFTVGNLVFIDANNNGVVDAGESGISGVTVELLDSAGASFSPAVTTTTNASGAYGFLVYTPGTYKVKVTPSSTYRIASTSAGTDNGTDNNNDGTQPVGVLQPSTSFAFTLTAGGEPGTAGTGNSENTIDFGFRACPTITVSPTTLANATVGTAYSQGSAFSASGGTAPYSWSASGVPAGMAFDSVNKVLTGSPTTVGAYTVVVTATDAYGCVGSANVSIRVCPVITVTLPSVAATVGTAYSQTVTASGGTAAYTFGVNSGALPAWATLNTATGAITGTPNNLTAATFTLRATDSTGCVGISPSYTITPSCPTISVAAQTLPFAYLTQAYSQPTAFSATGLTGTYTWTASGVPAGMAFDAVNKKLTGTPTAAVGTYTVTITATDSTYASCAGSNTYTVRVCPVITITPSTVSPLALTRSTAMSTLTFTASGGTANYTWAMGGTLPTGLTFTPGATNTATITGTPTVANQSRTVTLTATDANGCASAPISYTISVGCPPVSITPATVGPFTQYQAITTVTFVATGTSGAVTWSATNLPAGLSLSTAGVLSGTPTANPGTYATPVVTVTDADACTGTRPLSIVINCPTVTITTASLPNGVVGTAYTSTTLAATTAGTGVPAQTYTWSVSPALPTGMTLSTGGVISGTPSVATASTSYTFTASNQTSCVGTRALSFSTNCPTITVSPTSLANSTLTLAYNQATAFSATGISGTFNWSASGVPAGLTLNTTSLKLEGTPTAAIGSYNVTVTATSASYPGCSGSVVIPLRVCPNMLVSLSGTSATVGTAFSQTVSQSGSTATPISYAVNSGALPAWATLNASTGAITGTPNNLTAATFTLKATDATGCVGISPSYTITPVCPTITVTPGSLLQSTTGTAYTQATAPIASGISGTFTWTASGLPAGMSINSSTGALSTTTAAAAGLYPITVTATSATYPSCSGAWSGNFRVCPIITVTPSTVSPLALARNAAMSTLTFTASGGATNYTWALSGTLPAGLTWTPAVTGTTATITGTPTTVESRTFTVTATDANGCAGSINYTIAVGCQPITLSPASAGPFTQYAAITSVTFTATGNVGSTTWAASGLPAGLSLSTGGVLSGTPTANPGTYNATITATDSQGCPGSAVYSIVIGCPTVTITTATLPNGVVGTAYTSTTLAATTAGTGVPAQTYTWSVSPALPTGMTLSTGGVISGTPSVTTALTSYTFTASNQTSCVGTKALSFSTTCPTITVLPTTLADTYQTVAYNQATAFSASGISGTFNWAASGVPAGLSLNTTTLKLTGTPTAAVGLYNVTVTATSASYPSCSGSVVIPLRVCPNLVVTLSGTSATVGTAFSQTVSQTGSTATPITYSVNSGALPAWATLNTATGAITGTPNNTTAATFTLKATDVNGCFGISPSYTITPACPTITVSPGSLLLSTAGTAYTQATGFSATGLTGTYTWTTSALPAGFSFDTVTKKLSTTTAAAVGVYSITVTATDSTYGSCSGNVVVNFRVCPVLAWSPATLAVGTVGTSYSQTLVASNGTSPYTYGIVSGTLPAGLALNTSTGAVTGTPTTANGTGVNVTFSATDTNGCPGTKTYLIQICPPITISPTSLANGIVSLPYSQTITASGGATPYNYAVSTGTLPAGLTLNGTTGVISGTPTTAGSSTFTIRATDTNGCIATQSYTVAVTVSLDFGDYTGFSANAQVASTEIRIGTNATDAEAVNPSTGTASADDTTGTDDEDLTMSTVSPGLSTTFTIPVTLSGAVTNGRLMLWADWDGNNLVSGTNEVVTATPAALVAGTNNVSVTFTPPASTSLGTKYLRIVAVEGTTAPTFGSISGLKGEVEDYPITVGLHSGCDYGDLADTGAGTGTGNYKTTQSDSGAAHLIVSGLLLGSTIDGELDGQPNSGATGDGADEDSLTLPTFVKSSSTAITVRATNTSGVGAYLSLWIDWNNNGSFEDAGEKIANDVAVANGTNNAAFNVTFTVPVSATTGSQVGVRVRLSQDGGLLSYGLSTSGEVEDYLSAPILSGVFVGNLVWNDLNNNGTYDSATESGIDGVTVTALGFGVDDTQGTADDTTATTTTSGGGIYSFLLQPGRYIIRVTPPAAQPLASVVVTTTDNGVDNDNNGSQTGGVNQPVNSPVITLTANGEPGSAGTTNTENTIDFGLRACPTISQAATGSWSATQYTAYTQTINASGGVSPYTWSKTGTLPGGLTFTGGATSATISGTPDGTLTVGSYPFTVTSTDALGCSVTQSYTLVLGCPVVSVAPGTLPGGVQDAAYSQTMTASGGTVPYTWSVTGTLPAGLTTSTPTSSTFRISGTPTTVESRTFTVRATDKWGCFKDTTYTIAIGCPPINISPASVSALTQYQAMTNVVFSATGGRTPYTWSIDGATPLPAGLTFTPATATLSGTPTAAPGTYNFNVLLTDNSGCPGSKSYSVTINCPAVTISTASPLTGGTTGIAYTQTFAATTAGTGVPAQTYTWTKTVGTLPPGLTLSSGGVLSGTPTAAGTYTFTLQAANQQSCAGTKAFSLTIVCPTITLTPASPLTAATQYAAYSQTFTAGGGTSPYTIAVSSGTLPAGLSLTGATATTINLTGSPTAAPGAYSFSISATDANNCVLTRSYSLTINCPTISVAPATVGPFTQYATITNVVFSASGGTAPYTWSIDAATPLPAGLTFTPATATLSGAPTAAPGSYTVNVKLTDANNCAGNRSYTVVVNCNTVTIAPTTLPNGTVGTAYSQTPTATLSGTGVPAQTWTWSVFSGALPAGLSLNTSTGAITGTPTGAGTYNFTLRVVNAQGCAATQAYTVVMACPTMSISTGTSLPAATQYTAYSTTLAGTGGTLPYTWSVIGGSLPAGLSLNASTGIISGNPTSAPATFNFTVQVSDNYGCAVNKAFSLVLNCPTITITPATLPSGTQYAAYSQTLTATTTGTSVPAQTYAWSVSAGVLPAGLTLNSTTGVISGTPTTVESQTFTIRVADTNNCFGVQTYTVGIGCPPIVISPSTLTNATQYAAYSVTFTASGGTAPYAWALDTGSNALPTGLTLSTGGLLGGTPTAVPGNYTFRVKVTDAGACPGYQNFTLTIVCPTIGVAPASVSTATVGVAYSQTITASGGTTPYTYSVSVGSLPAGLSINGTTGVISGTANVMPGSFPITVLATDTNGCSGSRAYTLNVIGRDYGDYSGVGSASALVNATLKLGAAIDPEGPTTGNSAATADDLGGLTPDDEDGVTIPVLRRSATSAMKVVVNNGTASTAYVSAWIDWNNNNTFDAGEQVAADAGVPTSTANGSLSLPIAVPSTATTGANLALRVRLSAGTARAATGDDSLSGEVEDYLVQVLPAVVGLGNVVFRDANSNGRYDSGEGVDGVLVELWLQGGASALQSMTTANGGRYLFNDLTPGNYFVKIPASEFASGKPLFNNYSVIGAGTDTGTDDSSDENGVDASSPATTGVSTGVVMLSLGGEPTSLPGTESGYDALSDDAQVFTIENNSGNTGIVGRSYLTMNDYYGGNPLTTIAGAASFGANALKGMSYDPVTSKFTAFLSTGDVVTATSLSDLVGATGSYTVTTNPFTGAGVTNFGKLLGLEVVGTTVYTIENNSTNNGIRGVQYSSLANFYAGSVSTQQAGAFGVNWFNGLGYDRLAGKFYGFSDPNGNGTGQVVTANSINNLVDGTSSYATLGPVFFGAGMTNFSKTLAIVTMAPAVTTGDSNIDLTVDMGFKTCPTISISPASLAAAVQYTPITTTTLTASGGNGTYTWSVISGTLPTGITLTSAGVLSGNPTAVPGTYNFTVQATDIYSCAGTKAYSITVSCPTISIAPATIPAATMYQAYSQTFTPSTSGTSVPAQTYTWSLSAGTLPTGLTFSNGVISGTPTSASTPGSYPITVRVQDVNGCFTTKGYTLVLNCPTITVAPASLPNGTQDTPYTSTTMSTSGGTSPYTWSVVGTMPTGLSIDSVTGVVSGTPTVVQSSTFSIKATDAKGCTGQTSYTIAISCPVITITPASATIATTQYAAMTAVTFSATGGRTPYVWSIDSATPLPAGFVFTPATATLSGTPTVAPGSYTVNVKLVDNSGCPANKAYTITVACNTVTITTATPLPNASVGTPYSQNLAATLSGTGVPAQTWTWTVQTGTLPAGLSLSSAGAITGTPTTPGTSNFTVQATNTQGCAGTKAMTITTACPTIVLNPTTLPTGYVNGAYSQTVTASGGTGTYAYAITSGTLPAGLAFNTSTGAITGTPTATASVTLVIEATDSFACKGNRSYPLTVKTMGIGNLVFDDCNNNGVFDGGDSGLAGALVQLFRPGADNTINTADDVQVGVNFTTTSTGAYSFTSIPPGSYFVKVTPPATHQKSGGTPVALDNQTDNDNNGTQSAIGAPLFSPLIALADGAEPTTDGDTDANTDWTADFGVWSGTRVGNLVWNDANNNGLKDTGETGIDGLTVELMSPGADNAVGGTGGNADTAVATTTTAGGGLYGFLVYTVGNYYVRVTPNTPYVLPSSTAVNLDNQVDNDSNGVSQPALAGTVVNSVVFNLSGCETDNTIDVGLRVCPTISITPASLAAVELGTPYNSGSITASGGVASYTWTVISGTLPTGLTLNTTSGTTASITGTASGAAGSYNLTLQARDALGCVATKAYVLAVNCPVITITPNSFPIAYHGAAFSQTLVSTGSVGTVTWSVSPALPAGLTLNTATGVVSGTPTAAIGTYNVTFTSNDSNNCSASKAYVIDIRRMSIGNLVWNDCNNNGIKDATEVGVGGAVVTLYRSGADNTVNTADDVVVGSSLTTGVTGAYLFTDIPPGNYFIKVTPPAGFRVPGGTVVTLDNRVDNDNNGAQPGGPNTDLFSPVISLVDGAEPVTDGDTDANSDLTVDFGLWSAFAVGNLVWNDLNGDGLYQSASELGVSGLTVDLMNPGSDNAVGGSGGAADTVLATTTTDSSGLYAFTVYTAGNYFIRVTPNATYSLAALVPVQTDNGIDNDNNGIQPAGSAGPITSMVFALAPCTEAGSTGTGNIEATIDIGVRACPPITITPASLAGTTQYQSYSQTLTASGGAATPFTWSITAGALPAGITLSTVSATTATLSGVPTAVPGSYSFTVQAMDALKCVGTKAYSITISCPTISIAPATIPAATQYTAYSQTFTATTAGTGVPAQTYTWSVTGTLPAGLSLNTSTGVLSGTPTGASAPGNYPITLRVQDANGCFTTQGYTLVLSCPTLTMSPATLSDGVQDTPYTATTMTATGGTSPYTWSVVGTLPTGLTLNSSTGVLSGTPTVVQSSTFSIKAQDVNGCSVTRSYTIAISCPVITINPVSTAITTTQYAAMTNVIFSATGGRTPYTWSIDTATPVPAGLAFTAATATLSGTPTAAPGTYTINVKLVDNSGCPANKAYVITVNCNTVSVAPASLATATVGTAYSQTMTASLAGTGVPAQTWTWSLDSGTLPTGLTLGSATGIISGTPTVAGSATITARATNAQGCFGTKTYTITVNCPTLTLSPGTLPTAFVNGAYSQAVTAAGGNTPYVYAITSGTLPAPLTFDTNTGLISGTPTSTSTTALTIRATDKYNCTVSTAYTLNVKSMGVGNLVWDDCNNNGIKDAGETGLAGATVQLFRPGTDNTVNTADDVQVGGDLVTTSSGAYSFTNMPPGTYFVKVTPPATHLKSGGTPDTADNRQDDDNNGAQSAIGSPVFSPIITLTENAEPTTDGDTDANTDYTVDFGFYSGVRIGNLVWADTNQNGVKDTGESGIPSLTVQILTPGADNAVGGTGSNADTVVGTTTTDVNGAYGFLTYTPGNYIVSVTPDATYMLPSLNAVTADNNIDNDNNAATQPAGAGTVIFSPVIALSSCETDATVDFGLRPCPILAMNPASIGPVTQYTAFTQTLTASGGVSPYTWSVQSGALPAGLSLASTGATTATVSGTPTALAATYNVTIRARDALGCIVDQAYPITVNCPTISIAPASLSTATQYVAYTQTFTATTGGTTVPAQTYTWSVTGALPAGLTFNTTTGVLSGTPGATAVPGNYPITIGVQNQNGCAASRGYTLVLNCPPVTISGTPPGGIQDQAYSVTLTAAGGTAPYTWTNTGALPTGLTLTSTGPTTATISGTPTVVQSVTFSVTAKDVNNCSGTQGYTIAIGCPPITINPASLAPITQYTTMTPVAFSAVGGRAPYTWSIDSATPLPAGLTFTPATATLSGTTTVAPGVYSFTVKLVDNSGCLAAKTYNLTVNCPTVTITPTTLPAGTVGAAYSQTLTATLSGTAVPSQTWTWSLDTGTLPAGLTFNTTTGVISGTPTTAVSANFTVRATNTDACTGTRSYTLAVTCPTMTITPASLPVAIQYGAAYSQQLVITGGTSPFTWSVSGTLPTGITLNTSTGLLSGSVTSGSATHNLVFTVTDKYGCAASKSCPLVVESRDYGDLSSLPAAASTIVSGLKMGTAAPDADPAGRTNANATADDTNGTDDEDGVTYSPMVMGSNALITVKVTNTTGSPAYICGWIDFNGNGTMEPAEQIVTDTPVATGSVDVNVDFTVPVPATAFEGFVGSRFRLASVAAPGLSGVVGNGEVEDAVIQLCTPRACGKTFVTQN